jgi:hypothetical protein
MALPTKAKQIAAVAELLEKAADADPPLSLEDLAEVIVDGYHGIITPAKPALHPHVGMAFKHPTSSSVQHVAWMDDYQVWAVSGAARYGFFVGTDSDYWEYAEPSKAKSGAPGNNPEWQLGNLVSRGQRARKFEVVATGDKCVLLMDIISEELECESNDSMKLYYKKERGNLL